MSEQPAPESSAPPPLEYSRRQPLAGVSRHRRLLIFLAICIAIAIPIYRYWQPLKNRVLWQYWVHRVAVHKMPTTASDTIIRGPIQSKAVPTTNPDYFGYSSTVGRGGATFAVVFYSPVAYRQLLQFDSRLHLTESDGSAVTFMGTLHRPDGTPRLVFVTGGSGVSSNIMGMMSVLVLPLPKLLDAPPPASSLHAGKVMVYSGPPPIPTNLKTGVSDPNDPSHIIFEFTAIKPADRSSALPQIGGGGIIDAHLQNDDSITFKLRSTWGYVRNANLGRTPNMPGDVQSLTTMAQSRAISRGGRSSIATTRPARGGSGARGQR